MANVTAWGSQKVEKVVAVVELSCKATEAMMEAQGIPVWKIEDVVLEQAKEVALPGGLQDKLASLPNATLTACSMNNFIENDTIKVTMTWTAVLEVEDENWK